MSNNEHMDDEKVKAEFKQSEIKAEEILKDDDVAQKTVDEASKKAFKFKESLSDVWDQLQLMISVIKDYISGEYRKIPFKSIVAILGGLIYFLSPIDVIPDFIPFLGYVDDVFVLKLVYDRIKADLAIYEEWKKSKFTV